jgi:glycine/D-amino acid oxidase-like deaminating enzyme
MAEERFDVLVIGGGITGVGIALDAASRGSRWPWWKRTASRPERQGVRPG